MLTLIKIIVQRISKLFLPVYLAEIIFKIIIFFVGKENYLLMIHGIWVMLASTIVVLYSLNDLFKFAYTRESFFLYTIKYTIPTILVIYTILYIAGSYVFYLLYGFSTFNEAIYKLLSLFSFYMFNLFILLVSKYIFSYKYGRLIYVLIVIFTTLCVPIIYMVLFHKEMDTFMIGTSNYEHARQIYNLIIPVTAVKNDNNFAMLEVIPVIINSVFLLISSLAYTFVKNKKINF